MGSTNSLWVYELGAGAGNAAGTNQGKLVIGDAFPVCTSTNMVGATCDRSGNVFVSDSDRSVIYKFTEGGAVAQFAGMIGVQGLANGRGALAKFACPQGIACDKSGNVYVADAVNTRVRKIDSGGLVTTMAGGFTFPVDVAVCPNGDIIVCDRDDNTIWRLEPGGRKYRVAGDTAAGDVAGEVGGAKVKGAQARFRAPQGVAVNQYGEIYVADTGNFKIKKITSDGWVVRLTGTVQGNLNGNCNVARLASPVKVACHPTAHNYIYIADDVLGKTRLKISDQNGTVSTVSYLPDDDVTGIAVSPANRLFVVRSAEIACQEESSESSVSATSVSTLSSASSKTQSSKSSSENSRSSASSAEVSSSRSSQSSMKPFESSSSSLNSSSSSESSSSST